MYDSSYTDSFSIHTNACAQKSWKCTCLVFDSFTSMMCMQTTVGNNKSKVDDTCL